MKLAIRFSFALALLTLLAALPAGATTFQMVEDPVLADQAQAIVDARVVRVDTSALDQTGRPATEYVVDVERVVKGHLPGSTVVVRVPGGIRPDGLGLKVWGAPEFAPGERTLLFLKPAGDGTYRILHLMLGAFHQRSVGGRTLALRDLSDTQAVTPRGVEPGRDNATRDFDRFAGWLADRAEGRRRARDYFVSDTSMGGLGQATAPYTLMTYDEDDQPIRWFSFDAGQSEEWRVHTGGQPGLGLDATIAAFRVAMQAWNSDPGSNVRYAYAGTTDATRGLSRSDNLNTILFNDPSGNQADEVFSCDTGGVIAVGGPFFYVVTRTFQGKTYHEAAEADIVTNDGTECFFENNPRVAEEVFAHELGHTLGLGHSSQREALMFRNAHNDGRGARLSADDREGVGFLYPEDRPTPVPGPAAPSGLTVRADAANSVALAWEDKSSDETGFRVERKVGTGKFREVLSLAADTITATVGGLTPGTSYSFRVRAVNGNGFSAYSNAVSIQIPATPSLAAPTGLVVVVRSGTEVYLSWHDATQGETGFRVERSADGGAFQEVRSTPANALGAVITGLTPGTSYTFRVRAAGASNSFSAYGNTAAVSTPASSPAEICGENGPSLCLLGRFRVEVDWRQGNGTTGKGTLVRSSDKTATVWFFDPGNVELILKVLDGRPLNNRFWVFSSALTDLEYWIKVTDTQTGISRYYHNRAGDVRGMADTSAFADAAGPTPPPQPQIAEVSRLNPSPAAPAVVPGAGQSPSACAAGPNALCLLNRFQVEVTWKNGSGATGAGGAVPGLGSTGYFWFFDAANVELVVKVLDGTSLNGKFWVFYGSLSDVESSIKVTDTQTGKVKVYQNRPGSLANLADTSAF